MSGIDGEAKAKLERALTDIEKIQADIDALKRHQHWITATVATVTGFLGFFGAKIKAILGVPA